MVANSIQNLPALVDSGQHSIVTAPADTDPSPRMRNLTLRGSGSTRLLPAPIVALSCRGFSTLIIAFPFCVTFGFIDPRWATVYHLRAGHHPDYVPALARCSTPERLFWSAHRVGPSVSRCAGATTMVHPLESIADTQPQLQPALPSLSAMISQYFTRCRCAVTDCSRPLAAQVCSLQTGRSPSGFARTAL